MFPINETLGHYSELFMLLAGGTYTVAFIAFAWDLAKSSKALQAVDLKAAQVAAAEAKVPVAAGSVGVGQQPSPTPVVRPTARPARRRRP